MKEIPMQDPQKLSVWQKSHTLTLKVYSSTKEFPKEEQYGLTSQMRRSSSSIPTNISEGCGRGGNTDFARFLQIAMGSACELEYQLLLSRDLDYLSEPDFRILSHETVEVKQMLTSLIKIVRSSKRDPNTED